MGSVEVIKRRLIACELQECLSYLFIFLDTFVPEKKINIQLTCKRNPCKSQFNSIQQQ